MSAHLLLITIGPVQDFIAQARRTRDLWFGSHALSELSRVAARALADSGRLIFPARDKGDRELDECNEPVRADGSAPISIANKILAEVGDNPQALAETARKAVMKRWRVIAAKVKRDFEECLVPGIDDIWKEQIDEIIEFYASWAPLEGGYLDARDKVERALAGRKLLRDFVPWQHDRAGAPKSSLDGARVSVLPKEKEERKHGKFARLRIGPGEQLDAVGLVKRAGFEPEQFVPIMNIAAAPWLQEVKTKCPDELDALGRECTAQGLGRIDRNLPVVFPFRHDASVFYPARWPSLFKELDRYDIDARKWGEEHVTPILKTLKRGLSSYVACLAADGDHMGKALDNLADADAHRAFSKELAEFPREARTIVESEAHLGSLVYAGGDDVLAFLPVAKAPLCARALAEAFKHIMGRALEGSDIKDPPTLSVGIGIGHVLEAMGDLLDLGREAEKAAKNAGRNALAIVLEKRSGGQRTWAAQWDTTPVERLLKDAELLAGPLATGKIYEISSFLRRFRKLPAGWAGEPVMLDAYVGAMLAQSGKGNGTAKVTAAALDLASEGTKGDFPARFAEMSWAIERLLIANALRANGFWTSAAGRTP